MKSAPRANITILIIFMLLAASVIALLVTGYVRTMVSFSSNFYAYHKAYYLAQWGLDLQLAKIQQRAIGYQDTVDIAPLYDCIVGNRNRSYTQQLCTGTGVIVAQGQQLMRNADASGACRTETAYHLSWGDAVGFPLFVDSQSAPFAALPVYEDRFEWWGMTVDALSTSTAKEYGAGIVKLEQKWSGYELPEGDFSWIVQQPLEQRELSITSFSWLQDIGQWLYYFVVFNPEQGSSQLSFCLQSKKPIALTQVTAHSFANYRGVGVWVEARRTIELPWFVFSTVVDSQ